MALHVQQKPHVERDIAVYTFPKGAKLQDVKRMAERIEGHLHILRGLNIKGFLISLDGVTTIEKEVLEALVEALNIFHVRLKAVAGLCDYNSKLFNVLVPFVKKTPLALFKTKEMMALAIGTSGVYSHSTILIHSDDPETRQAIASTLISNNYFVVMANSLDDCKVKMRDKERYDALIIHSYFGFMNENASVIFDRGAFVYEFRGELNADISERISFQDFRYRLSMGHKVFVFDLTRIYHMDMRAAFVLVEMEKLAMEENAQICLIDLNRQKIDNNAVSVLQKSKFWIYDTIDDIFEDEDILDLMHKRRQNFDKGLSNTTMKMAPFLIAAGVQTLELYDMKRILKSPSKQIKLNDLVALKPTICSGVTFDGDFEGELVFIFQQGISEILIEHILGGFDDAEGEDFLDAMSEFANSVSGKLKSNLHKKARCIRFSLPQSTALLTDVVPPQAFDKPAVLMTFSCEGHEFYIALTSSMRHQ